MHCNKCGSALRENARFCEKCGATVKKISTEQTAQNGKSVLKGSLISAQNIADVPNQPKIGQGARQMSRGTLVIICAAIVLVTGIVLAIVLWPKTSGASTDKSTSPQGSTPDPTQAQNPTQGTTQPPPQKSLIDDLVGTYRWKGVRNDPWIAGQIEIYADGRIVTKTWVEEDFDGFDNENYSGLFGTVEISEKEGSVYKGRIEGGLVAYGAGSDYRIETSIDITKSGDTISVYFYVQELPFYAAMWEIHKKVN